MTTRVYLRWLSGCKGEMIPVDLDLPEEFTDGEMMAQVRDRTEFTDGIRVSDPDEIRRDVMRARREDHELAKRPPSSEDIRNAFSALKEFFERNRR